VYVCEKLSVFGGRKRREPATGDDGWMLPIRKLSVKMTQFWTVLCTISIVVKVAGYLMQRSPLTSPRASPSTSADSLLSKNARL
jgi:hypothetical protein